MLTRDRGFYRSYFEGFDHSGALSGPGPTSRGSVESRRSWPVGQRPLLIGKAVIEQILGDSMLRKKLVKIVAFNHPATVLDLQEDR